MINWGMYQSKREYTLLLKNRAFDPKNAFWGFFQIKNGSWAKIEKRKTLFIIKFAIAYCTSATVQSKKLLLCGTSKLYPYSSIYSSFTLDKEINLSSEKMSIWPQNKKRKFDYQKFFRGQMPNFWYERFNFFFRINELSFEEDTEQKKSGYHSLEN